MKNLQFEALRRIKSTISIDILEHGYLFGDSSWKHFNINSPFNRLYFVLNGDNMVIQAAKEKILLTGMAIKEIAFELRFSDEFYFHAFLRSIQACHRGNTG